MMRQFINKDFQNRHFWVMLAAAGCILIAILSLVPGYLRPHTGAPGGVEHFIAYLMVAGAFSMGLRTDRAIFLAIVVLMFAAGVFEVLQIDIPGRSAGLIGFVSSSLGAWTGVALVSLGRGMSRRSAPPV